MKTILIRLILIITLILNIPTALAGNINVVYTIDNNYPIYTLLSINSILRNNISNSDYTFYIIENNLTNYNKNLMTKFINKRHQKIEFINIKQDILNKKIYTYCKYISSIGLARIYIDKLLPKDIDKVLYIDADTLILSDIKELYDIDLGNKYLGMVENITGANYSKKDSIYYNSGVILIDLKKVRNENSWQKMEKFCLENIDKFKYEEGNAKNLLLLPDQDVINIIYDGRIKLLDKKWNQQKIIINKNSGIIHFIGEEKPWYYKINYNGILRADFKIYHENWKSCKDLSIWRFFNLVKNTIREYKNSVKNKLLYYKSFLKNQR